MPPSCPPKRPRDGGSRRRKEADTHRAILVAFYATRYSNVKDHSARPIFEREPGTQTDAPLLPALCRPQPLPSRNIYTLLFNRLHLAIATKCRPAGTPDISQGRSPWKEALANAKELVGRVVVICAIAMAQTLSVTRTKQSIAAEGRRIFARSKDTVPKKQTAKNKQPRQPPLNLSGMNFEDAMRRLVSAPPLDARPSRQR